MKPISLERILQSQGLGSRKQCRLLIEEGLIEVDHETIFRPSTLFMPDVINICIDQEPLQYREHLYLVLNKPSGYECSHSPQHHASIFSLLPENFIRRGLQAVGRLDEDTTGLLLLTDQGSWSHQLMSPKKHITKSYRVTTKHPITPVLIDALMEGVILKDLTLPASSQRCHQIESHLLELTISEGQYHQVKRMVAAAGNRVEQLHRFQIGHFVLPDDLESGQWRDLTLIEKQQIQHNAIS